MQNVSVEAYRSRIGLFAGGKLRERVQYVNGLHFSKCMLVFAVLTILLHIGGIEPNPGPYTTDELMARMNGMCDTLMKEIGEIKVEIRSVRTDVDKVKNVCEILKESCNDLKKSTSEIGTRIGEMEERIDELEMQQEADGDKIDTLICDNENLKATLEKLEQEIDNLESRSRRDNLRFFGIGEDGNNSYEQCTEAVVSTLNKFFTFKTWTTGDISRAHRVGRRQDARNPRHLIAKFTKWSDVDSILKNREAREKMKKAGLRVSTDLTRRQIAQMKEAQADGKFAYFKNCRLVVEERRDTRGPNADGPTGDSGRANTRNHAGRGRRPQTRSRAAGENRRQGTVNSRSSESPGS